MPNSAGPGPASTACAAASCTPSPSRPAARDTSDRSPDGSAAASSNSCRVGAVRVSSRRRKLSSIRPVSETWPGSPNPPASSAGVIARGSSSSASGLPPASATIWSRTRASSGPARAESRSARASPSARPSIASSGNPASSVPGTRAANTKLRPDRPPAAAPQARAPAPKPRSSHCWSSTTQISGRSLATSDSRLSTASATRKRSGGGPSLRPNTVRSASCCGTGSRSNRSSIGASS